MNKSREFNCAIDWTLFSNAKFFYKKEIISYFEKGFYFFGFTKSNIIRNSISLLRLRCYFDFKIIPYTVTDMNK